MIAGEGGIVDDEVLIATCKKISVVHSDRPKRAYLNPPPDSRIRPPWCGFAAGSDEEWGGEACTRQDSLA